AGTCWSSTRGRRAAAAASLGKGRPAAKAAGATGSSTASDASVLGMSTSSFQQQTGQSDCSSVRLEAMALPAGDPAERSAYHNRQDEQIKQSGEAPKGGALRRSRQRGVGAIRALRSATHVLLVRVRRDLVSGTDGLLQRVGVEQG